MTSFPLAAMTRLADALVGLAAAPACAGCGSPGLPLCEPCSRPLRGPASRVAGPGPAVLAVLAGGGARPPPAAACAPYTGPVPRLVNAWKERGRHDLEPVLGEALARAVAVLPGAGRCPAEVVLVPVPSSRVARRRRGADGVQFLAGHAARALRAGGVAARVHPVLRVVRPVADQSGLSAAERARNVAGAFGPAPTRWSRGVPERVVLVDDVLTTGATLAAATAALAVLGTAVDGWACVAATPLRRTELRRTERPLSARGRQD